MIYNRFLYFSKTMNIYTVLNNNPSLNSGGFSAEVKFLFHAKEYISSYYQYERHVNHTWVDLYKTFYKTRIFIFSVCSSPHLLKYKSEPVDYVENEKQNWERDQKELVNPEMEKCFRIHLLLCYFEHFPPLSLLILNHEFSFLWPWRNKYKILCWSWQWRYYMIKYCLFI